MAKKRVRRGGWGWRVLAGLLVLLAGLGMAWGLALYFPNQARASQYTAAPRCPMGPVQPGMDCIEWVAAKVSGNWAAKNQDTLSLENWPQMTFTDPADQVAGLRSGDEVQVPVWHGGANGVSVDGQFFYSDQSAVQQPMHDVVFAMFGASALSLTALLSILHVLRRRGARPAVVRAVKWILGSLSAGLLIEAVGSVMFDSLWGGPPFIAVFVLIVGGLILILLGLYWITRLFRRRRA